jgi:hypothetical protein
MLLTPVQRDSVERWLKARRVEHCPTCGLHDYYIGELTAAPVMVQIICGNCAHVLLFDGRALGLVR